MATLDIFSGDAFSMVELTNALNKVPHKPQYLGGLGIFQPRPIRTLAAAVEKRDGVLSLISASQRGAPLGTRGDQKRDIRDFRTVRIAQGDRLTADEIQSIRAFGSETELMQVQDETMRKLTALRDNIELTHEHMRLGAIQGIVVDADGSTELYDWFDEWDVTAATEIDFALGTAGTNVRGKCTAVVRAMQRAAKGSWTPGTKVHAVCGDAFYDALIGHATVRDTFLNHAAAADLRADAAFRTFEFGGILFANYQGTDDNSTVAVNTDKAKFFPVGARDVFQVCYSPAENFDFVNTPGQEVYAMVIPDKDRNAFVDIEVYSYPLHLCLRPEMLQSARRA